MICVGHSQRTMATLTYPACTNKCLICRLDTIGRHLRCLCWSETSNTCHSSCSQQADVVDVRNCYRFILIYPESRDVAFLVHWLDHRNAECLSHQLFVSVVQAQNSQYHHFPSMSSRTSLVGMRLLTGLHLAVKSKSRLKTTKSQH